MVQEIDLNNIDITTEPPAEEPQRQYYFMAKCKEWVKEFERKKGYSPKACIRTFGCQMNARDSEKISGILSLIGYELTEKEDADLILFNTCTVRENANLKVYGHLGQLKPYKKAHPDTLIMLCGCMMQEKDVVEKIKQSYRNVDIIFGTHNIYKFAELLSMRLLDTSLKRGMIIDVWKDTDMIVEELPVERKYPFKSGVNIMFGCNNFCSYCIVPYVRGRERSREPEDILHEIRSLVEDGVVEIMLLGQNVNSYGRGLKEQISFAQLLKRVDQIEGLQRIRFMTSHPKDLSDELIEVMRDSRKICRHLHLPLQSGSTRLLKEMNRHYTKESYLELAEKIRKAMPDISLTTDIIVGYPGETEEDFADTMDVVEQVQYDSAFTFIYSKRTGTPAAAREDQVPEEIVKKRFEKLLKRVQEISAERIQREEGSVEEVLVEGIDSHDQTMLTGRTGKNVVVHFPGDASLIGRIIFVKLCEAKGFYYIGRLVDTV